VLTGLCLVSMVTTYRMVRVVYRCSVWFDVYITTLGNKLCVSMKKEVVVYRRCNIDMYLWVSYDFQSEQRSFR
jgi:hypothetical protein